MAIGGLAGCLQNSPLSLVHLPCLQWRAMRTFFTLIILLALGAGGAWFWAGRAPGPKIEIAQPAVIGQTGSLLVNIDSPNGKLQNLEIALEQAGKRMPVFSAQADALAKLPRVGETRVRVARSVGKKMFPELEAGAARIVVTAVRPVLFGYRQVAAEASRDIEVRLTPPQIGVVSSFHFINLGGSE